MIPRRPPTSPPGGSYDWWWWHFGQKMGKPYDPPPEQISLGDASVVGFGDAQLSAPLPVEPGPWQMAVTTSVLGALTGWVLDEVTSGIRGRKRR